jgi:hypothetical protein
MIHMYYFLFWSMIIRVYIFNITKYHDRDMLNKYLSVSPNVVLYKYNYGIIFF